MEYNDLPISRSLINYWLNFNLVNWTGQESCLSVFILPVFSVQLIYAWIATVTCNRYNISISLNNIRLAKNACSPELIFIVNTQLDGIRMMVTKKKSK